MRPFRTIVLAVLIIPVLFSFSSTASAQVQAPNLMFTTFQEMLKSAPWRMGQLRGFRAFSIDNLGYDSDIYYGFLGQEYPDFTFAAGPSFQWLLPLSKTVIFDSYQQIQTYFFAENKKERTLNFRTENRLHFFSKKFYSQTGFNYDNSRRRLSPELALNVREEQIAWHGLMAWQLSRRTILAWQLRALRYNYLNASYEGISLDQELNRREMYADTFFYLQPAAKYRLFLNGQVGFFNFNHAASKIRNSHSYSIMAGLEFVPAPSSSRPTWQGGVSLGYSLLDPDSSLYKKASGFVGQGILITNLTSWLSIREYFSRGFNISIYSSLLHYLSTAYGGGLIFHLSRTITASPNLLFGKTEYPLEPESMTTAPAYKYHNYSVNLGILLGKEWRIDLTGSIYRRILLPSGLKINRYFVGFTLNFGSVPGENLSLMPSLI